MKKQKLHRKRKKQNKSKMHHELRWRRLKKAGIAAGITAAVIIALFVVLRMYTIDTVIVEGNVHYTNEEIEKMVFEKKWDHNSLYLSMKYKNKQIEGIPFVETMDVKIVSPHSVRITVYEKAMAGYVEYKGQFFYFDKDGMIVESSNVRTLGIPQIMGLKFDHIVLFEKLPVENDNVFKQILDVTQLLNKYEIAADKIYFNEKYEMTLYFDETRVNLGSITAIDEKIMHLKQILPNIEGKKGVLRMENYSMDSKDVSFELSK